MGFLLEIFLVFLGNFSWFFLDFFVCFVFPGNFLVFSLEIFFCFSLDFFIFPGDFLGFSLEIFLVFPWKSSCTSEQYQSQACPETPNTGTTQDGHGANSSSVFQLFPPQGHKPVLADVSLWFQGILEWELQVGSMANPKPFPWRVSPLHSWFYSRPHFPKYPFSLFFSPLRTSWPCCSVVPEPSPGFSQPHSHFTASFHLLTTSFTF